MIRSGDFSALAGLTNLQTLYLEGTAISNLNRLPLLPRLAMLDANYNRLGDLDALAGFTNLQWLNVSYNCLTNIDALTNLSHLTTAYLQINLLDTNGGSANMNVIQALLTNHASVHYTPQQGPPVISLPEDWLVPANETSSLWFSVSDDLTPGEHLVVSVRSSNTGLVTAAIGPSPLSAFPASTEVVHLAALRHGAQCAVYSRLGRISEPDCSSEPDWNSDDYRDRDGRHRSDHRGDDSRDRQPACVI